MNKIKFDSESIKLITFFESMTGAKVKDCIVNDRLIFVVEENQIAKAIGKNGINIKRMENALKRKIKLVEFSNDVLQFVKNILHPIGMLDVKNEDGVITIYGKDINAKAMLIGRNHTNLDRLTSIVKRYFDVNEIKVR